MPMPNDEFQWRPNDRSALTNLRYTIEAEKWVDALSTAQRRARPRSFSRDFAFISAVIQLVFCVLLLVLLVILKLLTSLLRLVETRIRSNSGTKKKKKKPVKLKTDEEGKGPDVVWNIKKEEKQYPEGWQLIFYTRWGYLRDIWQFLYLLVAIFIIMIIVLYFLSLWLPDYVEINRDVLIFAGAVSFWNALQGVGE